MSNSNIKDTTIQNIYYKPYVTNICPTIKKRALKKIPETKPSNKTINDQGVVFTNPTKKIPQETLVNFYKKIIKK